VQLGMHVLNAHVHVSKVLGITVIMSLQDVRAVSAVNACKACKQAATMQLQCTECSVACDKI
jgi:hypothetical protein